MKLIFKSLVARLVTSFVILTLATVVVVSYVAYHKAREALLQSIYYTLEHSISHKEKELDRWINVARQDVILVAHSTEVREKARVLFFKSEESQEYREAYLGLTETLGFFLARMHDLKEIFILTDVGGKIVISTDKSHEEDYRPTDSYYIRGRTGRIVQSIYPSPVTGKPTMTIAMPLLNQLGYRMGVLAVHLNLNMMDEVVLEAAGLGRTGETYLVDMLNTFVSSRRFGRQEFPRGVHTSAIDAALKGDSGKGLYLNYAGIPVVGIYRHIEDLEMVLISEITQEEAFAPARKLGLSIVLVGLVMSALIVICIYILARRIARPILAITDASVKVAAGDLKSKAPVLTEDEIGTLAQTFNEMTEKLDGLYQALRQSEEHFRTVFQTSPDSITICRLEDGKYINVSDGFIQQTGYEPENVLGKTGLEISFWSDTGTRKRFFEEVRDTGDVSNLEADFRKKDGSVFTGLVSATLIRLKDEPHILTIIRDISRLKQVEKRLQVSLLEKDILLKEIHHRVKNNLQVISGLLDLQAHHINDRKSREIYKESQNRVITMALIHEELYQAKDLAKVNFAEYIQNLTSNLFVSYGIDHANVNLVLEAEQIEMVVDTAIPCGLIVNELISNSLKHAFPGNENGEIRVGFRALKDGEYELTIGDNGIGLPKDLDIYKTKTLGLQLVTVLTEQLGGTLELNRDGGTVFRIHFKEYHEAGTELH